MAILKHMIGEKVISGFKGVIDFYYYMGIPCARTWPHSPGHKRSPEVMAGWPAFTYSVREWNNISPVVRRAYESLTMNSGLSARDLFMRSYMKGLYREANP